MAVTNAAATAYSNQKKLVTLSTGRKVIAYSDTGTNAKFKYSDDGVNWTDYSSDIAGWANGSIAVYVDAPGAVERIVAVWKQSGTGGGRTDGYTYLVVGSFNGGRTTLTWGTPVLHPNWANATIYNYPDIVANSEGTGGQLHAVTSAMNSGGIDTAVYVTATITGDVIGTTAQTVFSLVATTGIHTFPTIDIDPVTKRLFLAWSIGATGAGKGIRFASASYSAGSWTWGAEVEVDNTVYVVDSSYQILCRWDAANSAVRIFGMTYPNSSVKNYESTNFTSFTAKTGGGVTTSYGSGVVDQGTGDIYMIGGETTGIRYSKWNKATNVWTVETPVYTDAGVITSGWVSAAYSNGRIEWVYTFGNNSPYAVKYDYLSVNSSPAVTLLIPANNFTVDLTTTAQTFTWSISDPDGDTQSKYVLRRRKNGFTTYEYWTGSAWTSTLTEITSSTASATVTANTWGGSMTWYWSVAVRDNSAASPLGSFSSERLISTTTNLPGVATYVGSFGFNTVATGTTDVTTYGSGSALPDLSAATAGSWAIVFWCSYSGAASGTWSGIGGTSIGFTTGASNSYTTTAVTLNGQNPTLTGRRMAAKAITFSYIGGGMVMEADFTSMLAGGGFRLTRSGPGSLGVSMNVNFMLINGLSGAKVVNWTEPTSAGNKAVTGVGFSPDLVLNAGDLEPTALPHSVAGGKMLFGAFNKYGQQWANGFNALDSQTAATTNRSDRVQQTDGFIASVGTTSIDCEASFVSMDNDGFTGYFPTVTTFASQFIALCLKGVTSKVGAFTTAASSPQVVTTRHGFTAKGGFVSGNGNPPSSAPTSQTIWTLGGTDGTNQFMSEILDADNTSPSNSESLWRNDIVTATSDVSSPPTSYNRGSVAFTNSQSITMTWTNIAGSGGHENLYLLLGDPVADPLPHGVGSTTNAAATAYSNQKKILRLSTGRIVIAYADTTTNAKFKYSDDGVTWTDYSADIAGWSNGSIAAYVDSGGTERLVVVWTQSGTGGGRTDGFTYVATGALNTSRTVLTWNASVLNLWGSATINYSDIVAMPDNSTGGWAWVASSQMTGSNSNSNNLRRVEITASGVPGYAGAFNTSSDYGQNMDVFPSVDFNPLTKDVYSAWSAGTTGTGKGVRFKKGTYSAGSWSWGTEREIDSTRYVLGATSGRWMNCRFDGTRVIIGGHLTDGSGNIDIILYDRDTSDTTTTTHLLIDDAAAASRVYYGGLSYDVGGNVYLLGSNGNGDTLSYYKWTRATNLLSSLTYLSDLAPIATPYVSTNYTSGRIEWVYTTGNNSPYAVKYDYLAISASSMRDRWGIIPI